MIHYAGSSLEEISASREAVAATVDLIMQEIKDVLDIFRGDRDATQLHNPVGSQRSDSGHRGSGPALKFVERIHDVL